MVSLRILANLIRCPRSAHQPISRAQSPSPRVPSLMPIPHVPTPTPGRPSSRPQVASWSPEHSGVMSFSDLSHSACPFCSRLSLTSSSLLGLPPVSSSRGWSASFTCRVSARSIGFRNSCFKTMALTFGICLCNPCTSINGSWGCSVGHAHLRFPLPGQLPRVAAAGNVCRADIRAGIRKRTGLPGHCFRHTGEKGNKIVR